MSTQDANRKLTPAEYLAQLRRQAGLLRDEETRRDPGGNVDQAPRASADPSGGVVLASHTAESSPEPGARTDLSATGERVTAVATAEHDGAPSASVSDGTGRPWVAGPEPASAAAPDVHDESARREDVTGSESRHAAGTARGSAGTSATRKRSHRRTPAAAREDERLARLIGRIDELIEEDLGEGPFEPLAPQTLTDTGLAFPDLEGIVVRYLLARGSASGRQIAAQVCLPFGIVEGVLSELRQMQLIAHVGAAGIADYEFALTERGRERARQLQQECGYCGPAPVPLADYLRAMAAQSVTRIRVTEADLKRAMADLVLPAALLDKLGPAVNSGRGLFLFGAPGNGKTSIAERIARAFGSAIWIPRTLYVDGELIRLFDPGVHEEVDDGTPSGLLEDRDTDRRWVRILRPTVIAGGELTMAELEVTQNPHTRVCEAPLQLKSNCGTLVIDDFGRQRMPVEELLNRWIVPLEKRFDFLNLPGGKKVRVPFDQLIVFSTNLDPAELVDAAFLRRLPYKIPVPDPTREQFVELFRRAAPEMGFRFDADAVEYLIERHYLRTGRPFRACHPRDLLLQIKTYCAYKDLPRELSAELFDVAVENYFAGI